MSYVTINCPEGTYFVHPEKVSFVKGQEGQKEGFGKQPPTYLSVYMDSGDRLDVTVAHPNDAARLIEKLMGGE